VPFPTHSFINRPAQSGSVTMKLDDLAIWHYKDSLFILKHV
jgi:hypothetical protein